MTISKQKKHKPAEPETLTQKEMSLQQRATHRNALLQLEDDFAEFASLSAFLSNAFAATLKEQEWLTPEIVSGARLCSCWQQQRAAELKAELHALRLSCDKTNTKRRQTA